MTESNFIFDTWIAENSSKARRGMTDRGLRAWMEVRFHLSNRIKESSDIKEAVKSARSQAHWPVSFYYPNSISPHSNSNGIWYQTQEASDLPYRYWAATSAGDFYALQSLSEDEDPERKNKIFFFERSILEIHHSILFASHLCKEIGISKNNHINFFVSYRGLKGRIFSNINPARRVTNGVSNRDHYESKKIDDTYLGLEENIVHHLFSICDPLFAFFNPGARPPPAVYAGIVNEYRNQIGMWQI